jgi:cyclopropane fatty-acyl-phospholipid synthase-like methyltransferase
LNALNLYSNIEQYLDFSEEVHYLYDAYLDIIKEVNPNSLLDIGCGQGEFLQKVKDQNITTFGIDLSNEQIKAARVKKLSCECMDVKDLTTKYDCATAVFDVLNYIEEEALDTFISNVSNALNENAYFVFDVNSLYGFSEVAQGSLNIDKEDKFISIDAYFANKILSTNITVFQQKENNLYNKKSAKITQYYHKKSTLKQKLINQSFEIESIIDFNLHDNDTNDKVIFICRKTN